jgi:hypothetical protein
MPESTQKSLNSLTVNRVPLSVIMLLGTQNLYMISQMNSTALATDGGGRLHFDPFCEFIHCDEDVCESSFSFLEQTYQI